MTQRLYFLCYIAGSATPSTQSSKGSSGLSGGAIAGIVIGVIAGLAILAVLAFFILRRKRARSTNDLEANRLNAKGAKNSSEVLTPKTSSMHDHLGDLNHRPSGLDWKEGDEIKSSHPAAAAAAQQSRVWNFCLPVKLLGLL